MNNICIIPARGGSKRIPRKNIRNFLGKPIIAYSIEAAIQSNLFEHVLVSTDDEEIAEIAKKYGAIVPFFRSEENSNDYAITFDVIKEVVSYYETLGIKYENLCCLYACAPFVTASKIIEGYNVLVENKKDSVFPIMSFSFPIQRALKIDENHKTSFFYPEYSLSRSQDLELSYHDAGQFYWLQVEKCFEKGKIITDNSGSILLTELEGQDIDNEIDWKLAELKYELLQSIK